MTQTYKSGNASVSTSGGSEDFVAQFLSAPRIARLVDAMTKAADQVVEEAIPNWPISRDTYGNPEDKHHSVDRFNIQRRLTQNAIDVVVLQEAPYGYFIRSRKTGETEAQQKERTTWRAGETRSQYYARRYEGRKRNPWHTWVLRPGRKAVRALAPQLTAILLELKGAD